MNKNIIHNILIDVFDGGFWRVDLKYIKLNNRGKRTPWERELVIDVEKQRINWLRKSVYGYELNVTINKKKKTIKIHTGSYQCEYYIEYIYHKQLKSFERKSYLILRSPIRIDLETVLIRVL